MIRRILSCLVLLGLLGGVFPAAAQEKPTQEQVQTLTREAAALVAQVGVDKAREAFHPKDTKWNFGEVYVNVIDTKGTWLIYPPRPAGEGNSVLQVKDADGRFLVQDIIKVATEQGEGWVEYRWMNPASNRIEPKVTFVKKVEGQDLIAYVGIYR